MAFTTWLRNLQSAWQHSSKPGNRRPARCKAAGYRPRFEFLEDRLCPSALPLAAALTPADAATQARVSQAYGQLPLSFEANHGQTDAAVNFLSRGSGYTLFLTPAEAVVALQKTGAAPAGNAPASPGDVLRMELVGANPQAPATGLDAQAGTSNYFIGNDPTQWHTGIASYGRVEYQNVYAGINLAYYGTQRQLEYDFIVRAGANPGVITLAFQGAQDMSLDVQGNLVLHTAGGDVVEHAPVLYQNIGGVRQAVAGSYVLQGNHHVGFAVGTYDRSQALIIDPVLSYSTYLGGSGDDLGRAIAVDSAGNAYVTGTTTSTNFPTQNPLQAANGANGTSYVFVTELNATGTALVYSTFLGGNGLQQGNGIAVDSAGNAYVAGSTTSPSFPTKNPLPAASGGAFGGGTDAFVAELNATGTALVYSTYFGPPTGAWMRDIGTTLQYSTYVAGSANYQANGIAVDAAGNAYVTGYTWPKSGPGTLAFVAKMNATGTALAYSTYLGGTNTSYGQGIAVDSAGNAYVTGYTTSVNFPTKNPFQAANAGYEDAFVAKLNVTGTALIYSTYLGGSYDDRGYAIAVDGAGNAYITGLAGVNFPTKNSLQPFSGGDAFVTKLNATGTALVYSTFLGGTFRDIGRGIAVDLLGNAYVTGIAGSYNFPINNPLQAASGGGQDAFVAKLNPTGTALIYSTYLGGNNTDQGYGIAVDNSGNAYIAGMTSSTNFPTQNPLQAAYGGGSWDAFVAKIALPGVAASGFVISAPSSVPAGSPFNFVVMATDASGANVATGYTGTIQFTSSDGAAILPSSYTFTPADQGVHTFTVTLPTLGSQSLTITDNTDPNAPLTGTSSIAVIGPAIQFALSAPFSAMAGIPFTVSVTATDAIGSVAVYYTGTVRLTSTSQAGTVTSLGSYTFTAADRGVHTFRVTLLAAGTQSLTATDAGGLIGSAGIVVSRGAPGGVVFSGYPGYPATVTAGTPFSVTIAITDAYANVITNYTGTIHFTDSAGSATLPADYTFTASDQGVHTFTGLVLRTRGGQTLVVTDTKNGYIAGGLFVNVL